MLKAVIFDVDGTLVDSVDQHAAALQEAFRTFGHEIDYQAIRDQIGKGLDNLLPAFLSGSEIISIGSELGKVKGRIFKEHYLPQIKGFPKVRSLFQKILADGKQIALASSAEAEELEALKKIAGIADLIQHQTSADDVRNSKPDPDIFMAALKQLGGVAPEEAICIGDTPYDIEAAAKAGIETIALRSGGFPEETLTAALQIYDDPEDLLRNYEDSALSRMTCIAGVA